MASNRGYSLTAPCSSQKCKSGISVAVWKASRIRYRDTVHLQDIVDPDVIAISGKAKHPIARFNGFDG